MKKLLVIAGTRPEVIKLAPLILAARADYPDSFDLAFYLTGQHEELAREAAGIFGLPIQGNLSLMQADQSLNHIAEKVFERVPPVLQRESPDILVVQGDTTTAAMTSMTAFHMRIEVAHVEAGLRSFDLGAPYPEEFNRRIISTLATYNFCPTERALQNLRDEGVDAQRLILTGNTVVDALQWIKTRHSLDDIQAVDQRIRAPFVLVTAHRRESFGPGFERICRALATCASAYSDLQFVYPVHPNPNVRAPVHKILGGLNNVLLTEPVGYLHLLALMKHCAFVVTDSGGIQEESPSFGKYCIVLRDVTERIESVEAGMSELVGTSEERIVGAIKRQMATPSFPEGDRNPYGDGQSARRILNLLQ